MPPEEPVAHGQDADWADEPIASMGAADFRVLVARACDAFAAHRDEIDALNVFPVPDGDTGTNLLLTLRSALAETQEGDHDRAAALARGAVMGARGNSGVIFSQVLRALAEVADADGLDDVGLARGLSAARRYAYETVADPVEGTILSAIAAADDAAAEPDGAANLAELVAHVAPKVRSAVERTPEQLDVLRDAGVVDAGARGFEVFWETLVDVVHRRASPTPTQAETADTSSRVAAACAPGPFDNPFEVQYLLPGDDQDSGALRTRLAEIGDSVAVVGTGGVLRVHVHTNDVGAALEAGLAVGRPSEIDVTYLPEQVQAWGGRASPPPDHAVAEPTLGLVAVLPGDGLRVMALRLGACVVEGGAGNLPSVADVLYAVGEAGGEQVAIIPAHPNVVPTARQAAEVSRAEGGRELVVVDVADSIPAAIAAIAVYTPVGDDEATIAAMQDAAAGCTAGEVVAAVRDADTPAGPVRAGQPLAVVGGDVIDVCDDAVAALACVAEGAGAGDAEVLTLVVGADVDAQLRDAATRMLEERAPHADLEVIDGGQRPVLFYLGVE